MGYQSEGQRGGIFLHIRLLRVGRALSCYVSAFCLDCMGTVGLGTCSGRVRVLACTRGKFPSASVVLCFVGWSHVCCWRW
jgi:hypothetical protein